MEKEDFRRVEESGRLAVRRRAIRMIKSGVLKKEVTRVMGVRPSTVTDWYKAYSKSGYDGLKSKKPGVKSEDAKLLSTAQEQAIVTTQHPSNSSKLFIHNTFPSKYLDYFLCISLIISIFTV